LTKYKERLAISAEFDPDDEVYVVLRNDDQTLTYFVPTNNDSILNPIVIEKMDDKQIVTFYINETNVQGDFNIFLVINGREYNTYQHVEFN
jgi:hypothetical protein